MDRDIERVMDTDLDLDMDTNIDKEMDTDMTRYGHLLYMDYTVRLYRFP